MKRGILYIVWDNYNKSHLQRSIASAEKFGYDYHVEDVSEWDELSGLSKKSLMGDLSPFDTTLFLDADTEVMGDLHFGFEMAEHYGIACCIAPASSAYRADPNTIRDMMNRDLPQLNTGVIFFSSDILKPFVLWYQLCKEHPESFFNDQPYFSYSVYQYLNPFILPNTWNYRKGIRYEAPIYHGELKILHSKHG